MAEPIYNPLPWQLKFMTSTAKYRLGGGSRGGGKSHGMRMELLRQCLSAKGIRALALRRTSPEIRENMVVPYLKELPKLHPKNPKVPFYEYNSTANKMTFYNGSTIQFSYCQNTKDVSRYQGIEYDVICIEELTHWTEEEFKMLMGSLRNSRNDFKPNFIASTNPGGIGASWVKRLWVDRQFYPNENPDDYEFIPSSVYDNKYIIENNPEYIKSLESLPEKQRKMWLEGNWDVLEGQYFSDWNRDYHVIEPYAFPKSEVYVGLDYGLSAPSAVYWLSQHQEQWIVFRELYQPNLTYSALVKKIKEMSSEGITKMFVDPSLNAKTPDQKVSFIDIAKQEGLPVVPANNDRLAGWNLLREMLIPYDRIDRANGEITGKTAKLQVFNTCHNLIRTLPMMIHDIHKVEDLNSKLEDHGVDSLRYCLMGVAKGSNEKSVLKSIQLGEETRRNDTVYNIQF